MSERSETLETPRAPRSPRPSRRLNESAWSLSRAGVSTVYRLELRQRLRSRWLIVMIAVWVAVLAALTGLIFLSLGTGGGAGGTMFGIVAILVLSLAALVSPALSATSINGDRAHGVLAALQSTLLTPAELVIGKLLAAWTSALLLIATALPFLIWGYLLGGTSFGRLVATVLLIAVSLLVVCAIGLGSSAMTARTSASSAQTYVLVTMLGVGLPLLFVLTLPLVTLDRTQLEPQYTFNPSTGRDECAMEVTTSSVTHTEYTWWLLAASPYVIVADASPAGAEFTDDPLDVIKAGVREVRLGDTARQTTCPSAGQQGLTEQELAEQRLAEQRLAEQRERDRLRERDQLPPAWPYGLAIDLAIGGLFLVVAIRRLRTPAGKLPRDTRVA